MSPGQVGIFWRVATRQGPCLLADSVPLAQAEPYGECLTWGEHYAFWSRLAGLPAARLRRMGFPDAPCWSEYEEWPRGRVVFHLPTQRFVLYADRKLRRPAHIALIRQRFCLTEVQTDVRADLHYVSVR